ncbi:BRCA1-associated ATM activator 1 [Calypte anna]|uniref:BRCA1-associated ATM activator 1 n=2 Tax=Calypte anna TaxID=9244 RepID=A0A091IAY3_CALAN|nr:BRCA1-associated ATM activator 1 [Calypte anna]
MSRECCRLLPRVFATLLDPRLSGSDDTCLEKLLDCFQFPAMNDLSLKLLQDNPCLTEFLTSVLALPEPSPRILSFTLRLAGILAGSENQFQLLLQEKLLDRLFGQDGLPNSTAWGDATVRSGWVKGVHHMVCHQPALHFLCSTGGIDVIFTLQEDPSLFVASAAHQLLVNMLIFSIEIATPNPFSTKDLNWPECAQMIIKHIEDSLQSSSASRIKQSLKLLTALFERHDTGWPEVLWLGMAKQIESLLMEETLEAQPMLVDLLSNMARSPVFYDAEGNFQGLVTSVLEHLTPVQAGPLAVAVLKCCRSPQDVKIKALTVVLQPMDCILRAASQPLEYTGLLDESVSDPITVETLLSSKSSCVSLLCQTLSHLENLLFQIHLEMYLPYTSLLHSVMTILQFCNGFLTPASPLGSTISRILINSSRVQRSALDVLGKLSEIKACETLTGSVFDVLLAYLESPNTISTVLTKTFQTTSMWLLCLQKQSCSNSQQIEKILKAVFLVLQKRLCSPWWEVRDSSLEFLAHLTEHLRDKEEFRKSLLSSEVPRLTENLLEDPESYVRASAVTAVGHLAICNYFAPESPVAGNQHNKENTVAKLEEILSTDPEGFPRRAVISTFTEWLRRGYIGPLEDAEKFVSRVIQTVEHDLDWEVRLGGLKLVKRFFEIFFKKPKADISEPSTIHQDECVQAFCRAKLFRFLFRSLCDCDKPVGQSACHLLLGFRSWLYPFHTLEASQRTGDAPARPSIVWLQSTLRQGSLAQNFPTDGVDFQDPKTMVLALDTINFEELNSELSNSSDYVVKSPLSLIQDILATVGTIEENEVDCY